MNVTGFVVQMRPIAYPGVARIGNEVTFFHKITIFYRKLIQVTVSCFKTVVMSDKQQFAITTFFLMHGIFNYAVCRSINRRIYFRS